MDFALDIDLWSKHLFQKLHNEAFILNIGIWLLERLSLIILMPTVDPVVSTAPKLNVDSPSVEFGE
jgi:hypothetical protein